MTKQMWIIGKLGGHLMSLDAAKQPHRPAHRGVEVKSAQHYL
jgi:hypothetical protein